MRKIINSATTQYQPVLTEELVLDDRPISGSFNSITSDAVYKAISVDPGNVPPVESTDNGKVLTASYGEGGGSFEWADAPSELPAQLGTAGQVLTVNSGATGVEWATPSGGGSNVAIISLPQSNASAEDILAAHNAALAAFTANKAIIGTLSVSDGMGGTYSKYIVCTKVWDSLEGYTFQFSGTMEDYPGSDPAVPLYVWAKLTSESAQYKCASLGVTLQTWNPWYIS